MELREYLRVIGRRKAIVLSVLVVVVAATLGFSLLQAKRYTAVANILIQPEGTPPQLNSTATSTLQPSDIQTQEQLLSSEPVKAGVRQRLGSAPNVSVATVGQTDVITVSATSTDPKRTRLPLPTRMQTPSWTSSAARRWGR